jgi:hypothetical protein
MGNSRPDAKPGFMGELIQLWPASSGQLYRAPGTDICRLCPIGADWGDDPADPLAPWPVTDRRWRWLAKICDESERGRVNELRAQATQRLPQCPLAKVYWHLGSTWVSVADGQRALHRAEEIARQTLDPTRPGSVTYFERALMIERDRLDFVASLRPAKEVAA